MLSHNVSAHHMAVCLSHFIIVSNKNTYCIRISLFHHAGTVYATFNPCPGSENDLSDKAASNYLLLLQYCFNFSL